MMSSVAVLLALVVCCHGLGVDDVPPRPQREVKNPTLPTLVRECSTSDDCANDRACSANRCLNPCVNVCGDNAVCRVAKHIPVCSCIDGFIGDPMEGCTTKACPKIPPRDSGNKKFYVESSFKVNWFYAFYNCQSRGMRLATIENKEQNEDLIAELEKSHLSENIVWVGATDQGKHDHWYWMTTGQPLLRYTNWTVGQPDNWGEGGQHCLEYWKPGNYFEWNDGTCPRESHFACEYFD